MPTTGSKHDRSDTRGERDGPGGRFALLHSPTPQCHDRIQSWLHAAVVRGDKLATVAVPADLRIGGHPDEAATATAMAGSTWVNYLYSPRPSGAGGPAGPADRACPR